MPTADKSVTLHLPRLYPKQHRAVFSDARYAVVEASTKSGKTVATILWLLSEASKTGRPGRNYWWIAPSYAQTLIAYRRLRHWLSKTDGRQRHWRANETERWIDLANGARLWFKSGEKPDNLYGEDVYAAVIDEASRCREAAWHAVRSTLTATRGPIRIIGNVRGRKNWAYRLARKAEAGTPGMSYARITADDAVAAGVLAASEVQDALAILPHFVGRELFYAEASDEGTNPFGIDAIRACIAPIADGPPVAWGFDLAKHVDWTVGIAVNAAGRCCGFQRWQSDWKNTTARIRAMIGDTPALVDQTGVGDPIVEELQRACMAVEGLVFTGPSKQGLMEGLASAIQQQHVSYPDGQIVRELESFEHEYTRTGVRYTAPEGATDDCVDTLALVAECKRRHAGGMRMDLFVAGDDDEPDEDAGWGLMI